MEEEGRDGKGREEAEGEEDWERGGRARLGYFPVPLALLPPPLRVPSYATGLGIIPSIAGDVLYILLHYRKLNGFQWGGGYLRTLKPVALHLATTLAGRSLFHVKECYELWLTSLILCLLLRYEWLGRTTVCDDSITNEINICCCCLAGFFLFTQIHSDHYHMAVVLHIKSSF